MASSHASPRHNRSSSSLEPLDDDILHGPVVLEESYDAEYEPSHGELVEYSREVLGMDYLAEPRLRWLAHSGLKARLPAGWLACQDRRTNEIYFYNPTTKEKLIDTPCDHIFRNARAKLQRLLQRDPTARCDVIEAVRLNILPLDVLCDYDRRICEACLSDPPSLNHSTTSFERHHTSSRSPRASGPSRAADDSANAQSIIAQMSAEHRRDMDNLRAQLESRHAAEVADLKASFMTAQAPGSYRMLDSVDDRDLDAVLTRERQHAENELANFTRQHEQIKRAIRQEVEDLLVDRHRLLVEIAALREESQLYKAELTELEELHRTHAENDAPNSDAATDIGQNPAFYLRRPQTSLVNRSSVLDPQDNLLDRPRVADPGTSFSGRPRSSYAAPRVSRLDLGSFSRPRRPAPFGATGQDFVRDHNEWLARLRRSEPRSTGVTDVSANPSFHRPGAGGF